MPDLTDVSRLEAFQRDKARVMALFTPLHWVTVKLLEEEIWRTKGEMLSTFEQRRVAWNALIEL